MANHTLYGQLNNSSFDDDDLELPELRPKSLDDDETFNDDDAYLLARDKLESDKSENSPIPMVAAVIIFDCNTINLFKI